MKHATQIRIPKLSTSLRDLFPAGAIVAEMREPGDVAALFPDEKLHLGSAVQKRAQEFAAGRACARRILEEFGIDNFSLKVGAERQPVWPHGIVGSITHTDGFCAAVVARESAMDSVGIDSEVAGRVKDELWRSICVPSEIAWLNSLAKGDQRPAATLIFSAKEAFYKCQHPLVRERLNFRDATVVPLWGSQRGAFSLFANRRFALEDRTALPLQGQFIFHEEFITTGIAVGVSAGSARG